MFDSRMRRAVRCACILLICGAPLETRAVEVASLTLQQAVERTLERNPDLNAFSYAIEAGARRTAAGARSSESRDRPAGRERARQWPTKFLRQCGNDVEPGLCHRARCTRASNRSRLRREAGNAAEQQIRRLDASAEAARRFITVLEQQQALSDAQAATKLVDEMVRQFRVGCVSPRRPTPRKPGPTRSGTIGWIKSTPSTCSPQRGSNWQPSGVRLRRTSLAQKATCSSAPTLGSSTKTFELVCPLTLDLIVVFPRNVCEKQRHDWHRCARVRRGTDSWRAPLRGRRRSCIRRGRSLLPFRRVTQVRSGCGGESPQRRSRCTGTGRPRAPRS